MLGAVGWWFSGRHSHLLENVGTAITDHPLVSGVVGTLGASTLLVLFVYMAFTIVLIPLAILGILGELVVVLYGQVVLGYLIGTRLPVEHVQAGTVAGIGMLLVGLEILGLIPYVGGFVQISVAVLGFGAVLNTYFGLQEFEPVSISG